MQTLQIMWLQPLVRSTRAEQLGHGTVCAESQNSLLVSWSFRSSLSSCPHFLTCTE